MEKDATENVLMSQDNAATNMVPTQQPVGPTSTQIMMHDEFDYRMYRELGVVEL